jgi:hypothetical protein
MSKPPTFNPSKQSLQDLMDNGPGGERGGGGGFFSGLKSVFGGVRKERPVNTTQQGEKTTFKLPDMVPAADENQIETMSWGKLEKLAETPFAAGPGYESASRVDKEALMDIDRRIQDRLKLIQAHDVSIGPHESRVYLLQTIADLEEGLKRQGQFHHDDSNNEWKKHYNDKLKQLEDMKKQTGRTRHDR